MPRPFEVWVENLVTLRSRFFSISREPQTSRSHVASALPSGFRFEVYVCTARSRSVSDLPQGFLHFKTPQSTFENKGSFIELFR